MAWWAWASRITSIVHLLKHLPLLFRQTWAYTMRHRVSIDPSAAITLRVHCEQQPDTASRVTLSDERDALGMRRAKLDWRISAFELHTIRTFLRVAGETLRTAGLAELTPDIALHDDEAMRSRCDDGLHHMGGTVMSDDPTHGVVDQQRDAVPGDAHVEFDRVGAGRECGPIRPSRVLPLAAVIAAMCDDADHCSTAVTSASCSQVSQW